MNSKRIVLLSAVLCVAAVAGVWLYLESGEAPATVAPPAAESATPSRAATRVPEARQVTVGKAAPERQMPALEKWEARVESVVQSGAAEAEIASELITLFPTLPEAGKVETARHICDHVPDGDYDRMRALTLDAALPEPVLEVFYDDLGSRDEPLKLPVLLQMAQDEGHAFQAQALEDLGLALDAEHGGDFTRWAQTLSTYLRELEQAQ